LEAELKGLRAFLHFNLHQIYGQFDLQNGRTIPYLTQPDINGKPGKITTKVFYELLWRDLASALKAEHLPTEVHRLNKDALNAFAARFFLYKQDYPQAIHYAESLVSNYHLTQRQDYPSLWEDKNNEEVIFKLSRNQASLIRPNTLWKNYGAGKVMFYPSHKLLELLKENGGDRNDLFNNTKEKEGNEEDFTPIAKYPGNHYATNVNDAKVFRLSEQYLILAEAYTRPETLNQQKAKVLFNLLREARGETPIQGQLKLADILRERMAELCFEGHRYFDLKRTEMPIVRSPEDLMLPTDKEELLPSDGVYWIPIPFKEVQINPNLK
jgi:hypothetical protein